MESLAAELVLITAKALYLLVQVSVVGLVAHSTFTGNFYFPWCIGWLTFRAISFGQFPKHAIGEYKHIWPVFALIISLVGIIVLISAGAGLALFLGPNA